MFDNQTNNNICPLCNRENKCQVNQRKPCWCFNIKVPEELLAKLPKQLANKKCICRNCIEDFTNKKV